MYFINPNKHHTPMKRFISYLCLLAAAVLPTNAAKVDTVTVASANANLEIPMTILVVTPDGLQPGERVPVAYVLHGHSGNYRNWLDKQPRIKDLADQYRMIIVHPDGRDTWYIDSPVNPKIKMESFFVEDLIPYIDAHYPTIPDRSKRAITGLSMGGHGAMYLAFRHPDIFGSAASMSGGVDMRPFPENWHLPQLLGTRSEHPENWEAAAAINHIKDIKPGQLNIYLDCGVDDFFAEVNDNMHAALLEAKIPHDYIVRPGGHTWEYWNNAILHHLLFFSEAFNR